MTHGTSVPRWSAGEAIALLLSAQFLVCCLIAGAAGIALGYAPLLIVMGPLAALSGVGSSVWLHLRKERLER